MSHSHPLPGTPAALTRPVEREERPARAPAPRWISALLRTRLAVKLFGANLLIAIAALAATVGMHWDAPGELRMVMVIIVALATSLVANLALVMVALRPIQMLEETAERVSQGDLGARVEASPIADRDMLRVGKMINALLDRLTADRARMWELATQIIRTGDSERAALAHELHDSTAQSLAALVMQLSAMARDSDPALAARFDTLKGIAGEVLEEVRLLAHTIHPGVLDDLGLPAALSNLARGAATSHAVDVDIDTRLDRDAIPAASAPVLYRVAEEAVRNATRHGVPSKVVIRLFAVDDAVVLEVSDDGTGFDLDAAQRRRPGMGIFTMRERLSLIGGRLDIMTRPGAGTMVRATARMRDGGSAEVRT